jgi:hypothetical protein
MLSTHYVSVRTRRAASVILFCVVALAVSGCATTRGWDFADAPGVPAELTVDGEALSGTLVGIEQGALVFHSGVERGEDVEVIRREDVDYVYVRGIVIGTAVEVRDFDIVTRRNVLHGDVAQLDVKTRGYLGWGSAVAGVLSFFLVKVLADME